MYDSALLPPDSCSTSNGKCDGGHSPAHSGQVSASQKSSSQLALIGTFVDSLGRQAGDWVCMEAALQAWLAQDAGLSSSFTEAILSFVHISEEHSQLLTLLICL